MQKWSEQPHNSVHGVQALLKLQANDLYWEAEGYNIFLVNIKKYNALHQNEVHKHKMCLASI